MRRTPIAGVALLVATAVGAMAVPASGNTAPIPGPADAVAAADAYVASSAAALHVGAGDSMVRTSVQCRRQRPAVRLVRAHLPRPAGRRRRRGRGHRRRRHGAQHRGPPRTAVITVGTTARSAPAAAAGHRARPARDASSRPTAAAPGRARLGQPRGWRGRPCVTGATADGAPSMLHVVRRRHHRRGRRLVRRGARRHRQQLLQRHRHHQHVRLRHRRSRWPTRPGSGIRCGGQNGATLHRHRRRLGQRLRHQPRDRLRRRALRRAAGVGHARPWLGRNGINGSGGGFPARVGLNDVNAFWNGSFTSFGHSSDNQRQATPIDVVAHEFGHAIFQTTPGGAGSGNENGGINESTGDIFGALTEAYANNPNDPPDFQVGEEVNLVGNGPIRYMYNPSLRRRPQLLLDRDPEHRGARRRRPAQPLVLPAVAGLQPGRRPGQPDLQRLHVTGVGIQNAGQIYYNAMLAKTSTWRYANVRVATLNAAEEPVPARTAPVLQHGQGGLERDLGAGPGRRAHLRRRWRRDDRVLRHVRDRDRLDDQRQSVRTRRPPARGSAGTPRRRARGVDPSARHDACRVPTTW